MSEWRRYSCEPGHAWAILARDGQPETAADLRCRHGHEAVMAQHRKAADVISTRVICATTVDELSGRRSLEGRFYVAIECLADDLLLISGRLFEKAEALALAGQFTGMRAATARKLWARKFPLSAPGDRIDHD